MRLFLAALSVLLAGWFYPPVALADVGGETPGPGTCDYPMTGSQGMEFSVYHYECHGPTEENGSHWQAFYGGAAAQATVGVTASLPIIGFNASITPNVGVLEGRQYWACPDLSVAEQPDPVGMWSARKIGHPACKTIAPKPAFLDQPPPEPIGPPNPLAPPPPPPPDSEPPPAPAAQTPDLPKAL